MELRHWRACWLALAVLIALVVPSASAKGAPSTSRGHISYFFGSDPRTWRIGVPLQGARAPMQAPRQTTGDPAVQFSDLLGGGGFDFAAAVTVARNGGAIVVGVTGSTDVPRSAGHNMEPRGGADGSDAFVAEVGPDGHSLTFATMIGGGADDGANAVAIDRAGNILVAGFTRSRDFPTVHPLKTGDGRCANAPGGGDAFLVKLSPSGGRVLFSTCLGAGSTTWATSVAAARSSIWLAGATSGAHLPLVHALKRHSGRTDGFLARIDPQGRDLQFSTYLGGRLDDTIAGVAADENGDAYVVGTTNSPNFPLRTPPQETYGGGGSDAFVVKVTPGNAMAYGTYLGGKGADQGNAVTVDGAGEAYVVGATASDDFPLARPMQSRLAGGTDAFAAKVAADGRQLDFSTYLGGSSNEVGHGVALDGAGSAYIAGSTSSKDYPVGKGSDSSYSGGFFDGDAFIAALTPAGDAGSLSRYLGGNGDDVGLGVAVDGSCGVYVVGGTSSADFPVTGSLPNMSPRRGNGFVADFKGEAFGSAGC
jgi:hypothetical protein